MLVGVRYDLLDRFKFAKAIRTVRVEKMNFIKSLPFHLLWLVLVNCLFLSKVVLSESPSSENDVLPVNGYGLTILDNTNGIENPDLNRGFDLIK